MHQIRQTLTLSIPASDDLCRTVRASLVAKGSSLNAWCIANGLNRQTVDRALRGERHSRASREIVDRLLREVLGVENAA